jgi:FtsZ-interacting cell division protein ZipA
MSDLQIGLAMLGGAVVAGVFGYNWWQERQFRQRAREAFSESHDDILLQREDDTAGPSASPRTDPLGEARIEPRMEPAATASGGALERSGKPLHASDQPETDIDYVVEIRAGEFISPEPIAALCEGLAGLGRKATFSGFNYQTKAWEALTLDEARFTSVRAAIQLADRSGPLDSGQLTRFAEIVKAAAHDMSAIAELPDFAAALERAGDLDNFCSEVDVLVGLNVIARTGQVFHGTKIRALAEASGLQLQPSGVFVLKDEQGGVLFSLDNQEPDPFLADKVRNMMTPGITFLLDVPRIANGIRTFDRMVAMSRSFAEALDGILADDNRVALNDSGLDKIRAQLRAIYAAMERRGIQPGGPSALRLFS